MHGRADHLAEVRRLSEALRGQGARARFVLCPPAVWLREAAVCAEGGPLELGAQDCSAHPDGPHTGEHSAAMLRAAGAGWVLIGHSERRTELGETDAMVAAKAASAAAAGLRPVLCVGESAAQREAGQAVPVVHAQLRAALPAIAGAGAVVAYEPIWCIGGEAPPTSGEVESMLGRIHMLCAELGAPEALVLYGGSVKPENAGALLAARGVDGLLLGRASLSCDSFLAIARAL
jgi:triosephosphate isomerase